MALFGRSSAPLPKRQSISTIASGTNAAAKRDDDTEVCHDAFKTTLNLNDRRLANAQVLAAPQLATLTRLVEEGLHLRLRAEANTGRARQGAPHGAGCDGPGTPDRPVPGRRAEEVARRPAGRPVVRRAEQDEGEARDRAGGWLAHAHPPTDRLE